MNRVVASEMASSSVPISSGSVESRMWKRGPYRFAQDLADHFRAEARSAHPQQNDIAPGTAFDALGEIRQRRVIRLFARRDIEPAEPFVLVGPAPQGFVLRPKTANIALFGPGLEGGIDALDAAPANSKTIFTLRPASASLLSAMAPNNLSAASANLSTPSTTSSSVMVSSEMPTAFNSLSTFSASATPCCREACGFP